MFYTMKYIYNTIYSIAKYLVSFQYISLQYKSYISYAWDKYKNQPWSANTLPCPNRATISDEQAKPRASLN